MRLLKKKYFIILAILVFLKPVGFEALGLTNINLTFNYARILLAIYIFILYISTNKVSNGIIMLTMFFLELFFTTLLINDGDLFKLEALALSTFGLCLMFDMLLSSNNCKLLIDSCFNAFCILIFSNYIYLLITDKFSLFYYAPDASLLTIDNWLVIYTMPAILFACLHSYYCNKKYSNMAIALIVCVCLTVVKTWSGTGICGCFIVMLFLILFYGKRQKSKIWNIKNFTIISVVLFFTIVVFRMQNYFEFVIVDILQKDITFSGRVIAWNNAIDTIKQAVWFGHGHNYTVYYGMNAHNGVLEVLVEGGVFALFFYIAFFKVGCKYLNRYKNNSLASLFSVIIFSYFIMMITESQINTPTLYGIIILAYHLPRIINSKQLVKENL